MFECLKLDDNNYLVADDKKGMEIVHPKNKSERDILDKKAELTAARKDLSLCNKLIYNISSDIDYHDRKLKNQLISDAFTFLLAITLIDSSLKDAAILSGTIVSFCAAFSVIKYLDHATQTDNKNNLSHLRESKNEIENNINRLRCELQTAICDFKNNHDKRRVEEFFYTDSDLKQIEANIAKTKKHHQ